MRSDVSQPGTYNDPVFSSESCFLCARHGYTHLAYINSLELIPTLDSGMTLTAVLHMGKLKQRVK